MMYAAGIIRVAEVGTTVRETEGTQSLKDRQIAATSLIITM